MQSYLYPTIRPATPIIYYILLPTIQYQSPLTHRKDTPLEPLLPPLYVIKVPHSRADQTKSFPTMKIKPTIITKYISCSAPLISPTSSIQLSKPITIIIIEYILRKSSILPPTIPNHSDPYFNYTPFHAAPYITLVEKAIHAQNRIGWQHFIRVCIVTSFNQSMQYYYKLTIVIFILLPIFL